jgi:HSP20 family protein
MFGVAAGHITSLGGHIMAIDLWRPRLGLARRGMDPIRAFEEMFERFFDEGLGRRGGDGRGWMPAVDMIDRKDEILLRADVPGLEQKDIHVNVENGMLTIRGARHEERETKEDDYYYAERWSGMFSRTVPLPPGSEHEKIKATFKNGVLEVHIPKSKQAAGKAIEIQAA